MPRCIHHYCYSLSFRRHSLPSLHISPTRPLFFSFTSFSFLYFSTLLLFIFFARGSRLLSGTSLFIGKGSSAFLPDALAARKLAALAFTDPLDPEHYIRRKVGFLLLLRLHLACFWLSKILQSLSYHRHPPALSPHLPHAGGLERREGASAVWVCTPRQPFLRAEIPFRRATQRRT